MNSKSRSRAITVESLLEDLGGCGPFQFLVVLFLHGPTMVAAWNLMFMAYGIYCPGWTCEYSVTTNMSTNPSDSSLISNQSCNLYEHCANIVFTSDTSTIVSEWNLLCGNSWIASFMISLEMGGFIIGSLLAGHLSTYVGRKVTHFGMMFLHAAFNLIGIFSINWSLYAGICFLLGISTGSIFVTSYVYPIEYLVNEWRGRFTAIPTTNTGQLTFSIMAYFLRDWKKLHLATAIFTIIWLLPLFWTPESLRWLIIRGETDKANQVVKKIARLNSSSAIQRESITSAAQIEGEKAEEKPVYTLLDLCRHGLLPITLIMTYQWISFSLNNYIIMYGVKNLSGNFFINLIIFSFITTFSYPFVPFLSDTAGRRWGVISFLIISILCCASLILIRFIVEHLYEGYIVTGLSLLLLTCNDAAWAISMLLTVELYPTGLRTLSYSYVSFVSGVGAMAAPFLIADELHLTYISFIIIGVMTLISCLSTFLLPETKGQQMKDRMIHPTENLYSILEEDAA